MLTRMPIKLPTSSCPMSELDMPYLKALACRASAKAELRPLKSLSKNRLNAWPIFRRPLWPFRAIRAGAILTRRRLKSSSKSLKSKKISKYQYQADTDIERTSPVRSLNSPKRLFQFRLRIERIAWTIQRFRAAHCEKMPAPCVKLNRALRELCLGALQMFRDPS